MHLQSRGSGTAGDDEFVIGVVEQALKLPAPDREEYVRKLCLANPSLFETVWRYVNWDERMQGFLLHPVFPPAAEEPGLQPGQVLLNRFRIVRKVAGGGMGVVYEARDEKLGRRIAVKCAKQGFHARLSPEVLHGSEINHPNVCKTWEIHTASNTAGSSQDDFDFLTMEFIDGGTLADRLRTGPLPKGEARTIAGQICAGLAEAHRHQVIHGDLKPNNVLLARDADGVRAVITDFGLARAWAAQGSGAMSGEPGGAPNYMAPELLKGTRPSAASDIYALGVILHEMACGRTPFDNASSLEQRITQRPALLNHPWGRTIARCLEPDPGRRWTNASEVAAALVPFPLRRWTAIGAAVSVAIVAGAMGYRTLGVPHETIRLAILPFATDADSKPLTEGLLQDAADRLRRVRDQHRKLTVIPVRDAVQNKVDGPEKAATMLGATHALTGTLHREKDHTTIHAALIDTRSLLVLKEWDAAYERGALGNLPVALAGVVTGTLRLPPLGFAATVSSLAYPDFAAGVGLLQRDNGVDAALPLLARAVASDPDSPLTHARLAEAEARKYHLSLDARWLEQARKSLHDAQELNPDLALVWLVSGRIKEYTGFYEEAVSDLQRALQIEPRDGDAWRRLGQVNQENNRFADAAVAYQKAIETQPDYFHNYLDFCSLNLEQANYGEAVRQCGKVAQLVPEYSEGHFGLALACFEAGEYSRSDTEFQLAIELDPASSRALYSRGFALTSRGRFTEAIPLFQRALEIGPPSHLLYSDLGTTYRLAGSPAEARTAYSRALSLAEKELEKNPRNAIVKAQLAYLCAQLGQRSRARSEAVQARQLAPGSFEVGWWLVLTWEALQSPDEAIAILQQVPDEMIRRLNREADLADFRQSSRFHQLMSSRGIQ